MRKQNEKLVLARETVTQWKGVRAAARRLKVTPTQVSRHINAQPGDAEYSMRLAARMEAAGVVIRR